MDNLSNMITLIDEVADCFYQQKSHEGYGKLDQLFSSISLFIDSIYPILSREEDGKQFYYALQVYLGKTLEALEKKDAILIADILVFEIKERLLCLQ